MAIVNNHECDDCKVLVTNGDISVLNKFRCTIKGKKIAINKDKHFCSPACFINHVHKLINKDTNGNS